ncbi:MAG: hypothetical protein Q8P18_31385 [Pseudomonadota bacterium]|nr:hypothetical protein [Pseudomonadota bacterium]
MGQTVAILLLILGVFDALASVFCLFGGPIGAIGAFIEGEDDAVLMLVFYLVYGVILGGLAALKITAATRVFKGTGWRLAVAASIGCFVNTLMCCNVVSLVLGLVSLVLLLKPETRAALGGSVPPPPGAAAV